VTALARQDYTLIARQLGVTSNEALAEGLISRLRVGRESVVVDVGCGAGGDAAIIARRTGARLIGIDISDSMLSHVKKPVEPILADARAMPLQSDVADAAHSVNLMQLLPDRVSMFIEVARILRRGGRFALLLTNRRQLKGRFLNQFFPDLLEIEHRRYPSLATLSGELRGSGFSSPRCYEVDLGTFAVDKGYLQRQRSGIVSGLSLLPDEVRESGLRRLEHFIASLRSQGRTFEARLIRTLVVARKGGYR
jgi:ubiquinone/menaquinone biosynthesis C-methylase UbiE